MTKLSNIDSDKNARVPLEVSRVYSSIMVSKEKTRMTRVSILNGLETGINCVESVREEAKKEDKYSMLFSVESVRDVTRIIDKETRDYNSYSESREQDTDIQTQEQRTDNTAILLSSLLLHSASLVSLLSQTSSEDISLSQVKIENSLVKSVARWSDFIRLTSNIQFNQPVKPLDLTSNPKLNSTPLEMSYFNLNAPLHGLYATALSLYSFHQTNPFPSNPKTVFYPAARVPISTQVTDITQDACTDKFHSLVSFSTISSYHDELPLYNPIRSNPAASPLILSVNSDSSPLISLLSQDIEVTRLNEGALGRCWLLGWDAICTDHSLVSDSLLARLAHTARSSNDESDVHSFCSSGMEAAESRQEKKQFARLEIGAAISHTCLEEIGLTRSARSNDLSCSAGTYKQRISLDEMGAMSWERIRIEVGVNLVFRFKTTGLQQVPDYNFPLQFDTIPQAQFPNPTSQKQFPCMSK